MKTKRSLCLSPLETRLMSDVVEEENYHPLAPFISLNNEEKLDLPESLKLALPDINYSIYIEYAYDKYDSFKKSNPLTDLSQDQYGALYLYTCEMCPAESSIYYLVNCDLAGKNRKSLIKWRHYLHHLFEGLKRIKTWTGSKDLYRGLVVDGVTMFPDMYKVGNKIAWYSCTSATPKLEIIKSHFSELSRKCTIFVIKDGFSGRLISPFSSIPSEVEVIFPPGSRFEVTSIESRDLVNYIYLIQIPTLEKSLNLEGKHNFNVTPTKSKAKSSSGREKNVSRRSLSSEKNSPVLKTRKVKETCQEIEWGTKFNCNGCEFEYKWGRWNVKKGEWINDYEGWLLNMPGTQLKDLPGFLKNNKDPVFKLDFETDVKCRNPDCKQLFRFNPALE